MGRRLRVLVADDHEAHRRLLDELFTALDCEVTTVSDGEQALEAIGPFDVICLDRHMPGLGGEAAARALRGQAFLVACTSHPEGLAAEFDAVVAKPFCCCELAQLLEIARAWKPSRPYRRKSRTPSAAARAVANVACSR